MVISLAMHQLFEFTLPQPSVGIPLNALEEQREHLRNRHPGASGRNSQRSSCFLYFRGFKSIVISWIRWLHKNIDPCGSHITLPPASKKASRSSSMSEAHFAFALSRGYTQIDYFLAVSFRSSILACFSQFWRPWGFSIYHSRSRLLAFCSDQFRLAALILQNPSQHLRGARGRNIVLYSYGKLLLKSKVNDDELPSLFLKVPLTFQVVWKVAGTCPHLHSIIGIHPFPKDASWKHPCQISFCIQDTSLYFTTFPRTQYHFIMFLSSYPSGNSLETTCENQTTQLISKWFRCPCTILSTNWEMTSNTMFYFFLRVIMVLLTCIPITSPKRK